MLGCKDIKVSL